MSVFTETMPGRRMVVSPVARRVPGRPSAISTDPWGVFESITAYDARPAPLCRLRNTRLTDRLAADCALAAKYPGQIVNELEQRAFAALDPRGAHHDLDRGLQLLRRARTCGECVSRVLSEPTVRFLRRTIR